jgi:uncharacterized protein (DUF1499 family)
MRATLITSLSLAAIAALAALSSGLGYRWELWTLSSAFTVLRWSAYTGVAAGIISLVAATLALRRRNHRGLFLAFVAFLVGAAVAAVPYAHVRIARTVPPIHDITTDTEEPPRFVEIVALRADAPNSGAYAGEKVAAMQRKAYPDLEPIILDLAPHEAFERALAVGKSQGWEIVATSPGEGRIEATDETLFFGFKDDVVVRVRAEGDGSRIDLRSVSRVGRSDVGANARRIRRFLGELQRDSGNS